MKPTEVVDQFTKDWEKELHTLEISMKLGITPQDNEEIPLILRFIEQLKIIRPFVWNGLDYEAYHKKRGLK